jgi:hypothetical protein
MLNCNCGEKINVWREYHEASSSQNLGQSYWTTYLLPVGAPMGNKSAQDDTIIGHSLCPDHDREQITVLLSYWNRRTSSEVAVRDRTYQLKEKIDNTIEQIRRLGEK